MKQFIVNIDDFGVSHEADERISTLLSLGAASSVSCFVTTTQFPKSLPLLINSQRNFDIGVHLDLTFGSGVKHDLPSFSAEAAGIDVLETLDPKMVFEEFDAQIRRFLDHNLRFTHIDNHRPEIYLIPKLFKAVIDLGARHGVYVRTPYDRYFAQKTSYYSRVFGLSEEHLKNLGNDCIEYQEKKGVRTPDSFELVTPDRRSLEAISAIIEHAKDGLTELCTHAGQLREDFRSEFEILETIHAQKVFERAQVSLSCR